MNDDVYEGELLDVTVPTVDGLSSIQWRTANGDIIFIKDMADSHIRNSALFLMGMGYMKCIAPERIRVIWLRIFKMEWERRMKGRESGNKRFRALDNHNMVPE